MVLCCSVHDSERKHNCSPLFNRCAPIHMRAQLKSLMSANVCRRADVVTSAMHAIYINILIQFYSFVCLFVLAECECFDWREPKTRCHTQYTHRDQAESERQNKRKSRNWANDLRRTKRQNSCKCADNKLFKRIKIFADPSVLLCNSHNNYRL